MGTITGATAVFTITLPGLFSAPQQLQGFASDDAFAVQAVRRAELVMGVDGILSGGFVYVPFPQVISLAADSVSNDLFDQWDATQTAQQETLTANGVILLPSIGKKWTMQNGYLTSYEPSPGVRKLLQPRRFEITWENLSVSPF